MSNIRVDLSIPIYDGLPVTFKSPADCSQVTGLIIYYPEGDTTTSKVFQFADAHGNNIGNLDLFASNAVVKVILDIDTNLAFVQNADTNAYLESRFDSKANNPNLLRNWYFLNPVNQRGQAEYTSAGYCIDGWRLSSNAQRLEVTEDGIVCNFAPTSNQATFTQLVDNLKNLAGKTVTASLLFSATANCRMAIRANGSNSTRAISDAMQEGLASVTYTLPNELTKLEFYMVALEAGVAMRPIAAKLEFGSVQTLAHQDESGVWVLNEIPNKNEELLRCCISTADSTELYANKVIYHTGNKPTANDVGAAPVIEANSEEYDMDAILLSDSGFAIYRTGASTLNTPYKYGKSTYARSVIMSNSNGTYGFQVAFSNGGSVPMMRRLNSGVIGDWGNLYGEAYKPTAEDVGAVALDGSKAMTGELKFRDGKSKIAQDDTAVGLYVQNDDDPTNRRMLRVQDKAHFNSLKNALVLHDKVGGTDTIYPIYHEGNKPTAADVDAMSTTQGLRIQSDYWNYRNTAGWYRIAEFIPDEGATTSPNVVAGGCEIRLRRRYINRYPEYHHIAFVNLCKDTSTDGTQLFVPIISRSFYHEGDYNRYKKMRYVREGNKAYIDVYYNLNGGDHLHVTISDGVCSAGYWKAVPFTSVTEEVAEGQSITGTLDIPANALPLTNLDGLMLDGSNAMTGDLKISKSGTTRIVLNNGQSEVRLSAISSVAAIQASLPGAATYRQLRLLNANHSDAPAGKMEKVLQIYSTEPGESAKIVHHTGNVIASQTDITAGSSASWQQYLVYE